MFSLLIAGPRFWFFFYRICRERHQLLSRSMGGTVEDHTSICIGSGATACTASVTTWPGRVCPHMTAFLLGDEGWPLRSGFKRQHHSMWQTKALARLAPRNCATENGSRLHSSTLAAEWRRMHSCRSVRSTKRYGGFAVHVDRDMYRPKFQFSKRRRNKPFEESDFATTLPCISHLLSCWSRARGRSLIPVTSMLLCSFRLYMSCICIGQPYIYLSICDLSISSFLVASIVSD
jgi:hypothetical protein